MTSFVRHSRRRQKFDGDSRGLRVVGEDSGEVTLFLAPVDENDLDLAGGEVRGLVKTQPVKGNV